MFDAELWAISDGFELSIKETNNRNPIMITIFKYSQVVIAKIPDPQVKAGEDIIRALIQENVHKIMSGGHTFVL